MFIETQARQSGCIFRFMRITLKKELNVLVASLKTTKNKCVLRISHLKFIHRETQKPSVSLYSLHPRYVSFLFLPNKHCDVLAIRHTTIRLPLKVRGSETPHFNRRRRPLIYCEQNLFSKQLNFSHSEKLTMIVPIQLALL